MWEFRSSLIEHQWKKPSPWSSICWEPQPVVANGSVQTPSAAEVASSQTCQGLPRFELPSCRGLRLSAWELSCKSGMTEVTALLNLIFFLLLLLFLFFNFSTLLVLTGPSWFNVILIPQIKGRRDMRKTPHCPITSTRKKWMDTLLVLSLILAYQGPSGRWWVSPCSSLFKALLTYTIREQADHNG